MARRIIHIEPTDAQWAIIDSIFGFYTPMIANVTDEQGEPTGSLYAECIQGDHMVRQYKINPDGS